MALMQDGAPPVNESPEEMAKFLADPHFIHYVLMVHPERPGSVDWMQTLEHLHFTPLTPRNDLLHVRVFEWGQIVWSIVSIPFKERAKAEDLLVRYGLRAADGVPVMLTGGGAHVFPWSSPQMFTIERRADPLEKRQ